jgi:REP element-mobilizing transposase RayT
VVGTSRCGVRARVQRAQRGGEYRGVESFQRLCRRGHRSAMSLPLLPFGQLLSYRRTMEIPRRKTLPHEIPSWVDPQSEIYFITINCAERFRNQLAFQEISEKLFATVRHRQEKFLWWPHLFLLMPDHLHALLSFPPSNKPMKLVISKWKEWTAQELGIVWQGDFFEHRLRHDESRREKANYILENPVRKNLLPARRIGHSFTLATVTIRSSTDDGVAHGW